MHCKTYVLYEWNFVHELLCMYCTLCVHYGIITIMKRYAFQFTGIAQIIEHKRNFTRVRANHSKQKSRAQNAGFSTFSLYSIFQSVTLSLYPCLFELNFIAVARAFPLRIFLYFWHSSISQFIGLTPRSHFFVKVPVGKVVRNHRFSYPPLTVIFFAVSLRHFADFPFGYLLAVHRFSLFLFLKVSNIFCSFLSFCTYIIA